MKLKKFLPIIALLLVVSLFGCKKDEDNSIRPTVSSTDPIFEGTSIAINSKISATFNVALDPSSVSTESFTLYQGTTKIEGMVEYSGTTATFTPSANLAHNTVYIATITILVKNMSGKEMASDYSWSFTSGINPDKTSPTVILTNPISNAKKVALNQIIEISFSEGMDHATMDTLNITLNQKLNPVSGTVTYSDSKAIFTPSTDLLPSKPYTITVKSGVMDMAGNTLARNISFSFTTAAIPVIPDTLSPTVILASPANNSISVALDQKVVINFSERMDQSTIKSSTFFLKQGTVQIHGTITKTDTTATFASYAKLANNKIYTATVSSGIKDKAGNNLGSDYVFSFTTIHAQDVTLPTVILTAPLKNALGVALNPQIVISFSEAMDQTTLTASNLIVEQGVNIISGTVTNTSKTATFTPIANLTNNSIYKVTISTGVKDTAGNSMANNYIYNFTTVKLTEITPPAVISTNPLNNTIDLAINDNINISFSEAMKQSTITTSTFKLMQGANAVSGAVSYTGNTATFTPASNLEFNKIYTAKITTGAMDLAGNGLVSDYVFGFTTVALTDVILPVVNATDPINNATNVICSKVVAITFSEKMNPSTINSSTFILKQGNNLISGNVAYSGNTATFTPSIILESGKIYSATVTNGVKDLSGNALAVNTVWNFKTQVSATTLAPVNLGTAGNYVVLAKTKISVVPTSAITGNLGLSPAATSYITGFALTLATGYATSSQVTGHLFGADMAPPTNTNLTTAVNNMLTAYTDAAGRPLPDFVELYTGNIGGKTLVPGLYKWTNSVTIPSNLTISGGPDDVWIFQIAGNLLTSNSVKVTLLGGAQAKNIFWQIAGQTTIGTNSHFEGIILCKTGISFQTGASINGRALAQTAVTLDKNIIKGP